MKTENTNEKKSLKRVYFDYQLSNQSKENEIGETSELVILLDVDFRNVPYNNDNFFITRKIAEFFIVDNNQDYYIQLVSLNKDYPKQKEIALEMNRLLGYYMLNEEPYKSNYDSYYFAIITNGSYCHFDFVHKSLEPFDPVDPNVNRIFVKLSELSDNFYHYEEPIKEEISEDSTQ